MSRIECRCDKCTEACRSVPGLFMPDEAAKAVDAGLADRMMAIAHHDHRGDYHALSPLSITERVCHPNSRMDAHAAEGRCTFLTAEGVCEIHDSGFKPIECANALLCSPGSRAPTRDVALSAWSTPEGRRVLSTWARTCLG